MFHSIYIVLESGVFIFSKNFIESKSGDQSQLITGFLSALGAFATEALGSGMQSLKLQTGEQLSILKYTQRKTPLVGIAIADPRENSTLIQRLLLQIIEEFYSIFQRDLEGENPLDINKFKEFSYTIDTILEGKIASRTKFKMGLGILIGLIAMGFILLAFIPTFIKLSNFNISQLGLHDIIFSDQLDAVEFQTLQTIILVAIGALMVFTCILFLLPTFLAAYIAGNRQRGVWTAILLGISVALITFIATPFMQADIEVNLFLWFVSFSPLLLFLAIVCGFFGGRLKEQRKLYPLPTKKRETV